MHANKHTYAKRQLVLLVVSLAVLIVVLISVIRHKGGLEPQPVPEEPKPVIEELSKCYITENDGKTLTILSGDASRSVPLGGYTLSGSGQIADITLTDGTVSGVFASEGDSADGIKTRYGGLGYIEPINRYTLSCSTEKAYNSSENRYIHISESIYLKCTKDGSHQGRGIVTAIDEKDESKYTVEVTGGEFYMGETVDIYRNSEYETASRIGRGTVGRTQAVAVNGTGSVLRIHVKPGDTVERGELLFETVTGTLDGLYAPDTQVVSDVAGVVATVDASNGTAVEKDAKIATIYPSDDMQIKMVISEADLGDVSVGGKAEVEFNWDADSGKRFEGTISSISYLSEKPGEGSTSSSQQSAQYVAYVDFTPDETVRIGMTVIVYVE